MIGWFCAVVCYIVDIVGDVVGQVEGFLGSFEYVGGHEGRVKEEIAMCVRSVL